MSKKILAPLGVLFCLLFGHLRPAQAMPLGTLLYRTSGNNELYGYNEKNLAVVKNGLIKDLYTGHVAIYVGRENGTDYIVEAMPRGMIKVPAKYFINTGNGEKLLGAKIPKNVTPAEREKAAELAETLADRDFQYDFDFSRQKGPDSGEFTCVGLAEKVYESANIKNPKNLQDLVYNPDEYAVNITPDGYDNSSIYNQSTGDCFSKKFEFSKISRLANLAAPAPELIGYDAGRIYNGERYFFLPYTQFLQPTLKDVAVDIPLESDFNDSDIRGNVPQLSLLFRWSLINNPLSSLEVLAAKVENFFSSLFNKSGSNPDIAITDDNSIAASAAVSKTTAKTSTKKTVKKTAKKTSSAAKTSGAKTSAKKNLASVTVKKNLKTTAVKTAAAVSKTSTAKISTAKTPAKKTAAKKSSIALTATSSLNNANLSDSANSDETPTVTNNYTTVVTAAATIPIRHQILISKIYTTGNDDYIELYNPNAEAVDLAAENFRLEKTRTAADPVIMVRIGNELDGLYPGGTEIAAYGTYLIARDEASAAIKSGAQAIASNLNFSLESSGYTVYLGDNAISSDSDADIVDKVGFGPAAKYYIGSGPAPEILDDQILVRKANGASTAQTMSVGGIDADNGYGYDSHDNKNDFVIIFATAVDTESASTDTEAAADSNDTDATTSDSDIDSGDSSTNYDASSTDATSTDSEATSTDSDTSSEDSDGGLNPLDDSGAAVDSTSTAAIIPKIVISKIYTTGDDDYIELYNAGETDFDLAANNYRLEKTKTAVDPVILMRVGNSADGSYPGGTVIKAGGYYLIVRDDATSTLIAAADAIATGTNFTFESSGYTVYLGQDPISSPTDSDIIDEVGFGSDALYYEGSGPAPAADDNDILVRKASASSTLESMSAGGEEENSGNGYDSGDNAADFILWSEKSSANDSTDAAAGDDSLATETTCPLLTHLWHFDECRGGVLYDSIGNLNFNGVNHWSVGKFGCSSAQYYSNSSLPINFPSRISLNSLSVSFYYRTSAANPRVYIKFGNSIAVETMQVSVTSSGIESKNFPDDQSGSQSGWPADQDWHHVALVVDKNGGYWKLYLDGREFYRRDLPADFNKSFNSLEIGEINGFDDFDELAIWNGPLSAEEIADMYAGDKPLEPSISRAPQTPAQKIHHWSFDEGSGTVAKDDVGHDDLSVPDGTWITSAKKSGGIFQSIYHQQSSVSFSQPIRSEDLSIDFWWRSRQQPNNSYSQFALKSGNQNIFVLEPGDYYFAYYFDNAYNIIGKGLNQILPYDGYWHHIAFIYDSYQYSLSLYIDGTLKMSRPYTWLEDEPLDHLEINYLNGAYEIDELNIWQGALTPEEVRVLTYEP